MPLKLVSDQPSGRGLGRSLGGAVLLCALALLVTPTAAAHSLPHATPDLCDMGLPVCFVCTDGRAGVYIGLDDRPGYTMFWIPDSQVHSTGAGWCT
jgi:hypothetical protein